MKKRKNIQKKLSISKFQIIGIGLGALLIGSIGYNTAGSFVPVNRSFPVLGTPSNFFLKGINYSDTGYAFASQSTKGGKSLSSNGIRSPTITTNKNGLVTIHLINEDKNEKGAPSQHNFNIDEFNVHSDTLSYFQTDTITFVADKKGSFEYYCSIHPEMRGLIVVE